MNPTNPYIIGEYLNMEQTIAIEYSLILLQQENHFNRTEFWGRIQGVDQDYYIICGYKDGLFKYRRFFYSIDEARDWSLLPKVKNSARHLTKLCTSLFLGEPSHVVHFSKQENYLGEDGGDLKEEDRLAVTIEMINAQAAVLPVGALSTQPTGTVYRNFNFQGLSQLEGQNLKSFMHFENLSRDEELFPYWNPKNTINKTFPQESWKLQKEYGGRVVTIRSLQWPGMYFYHVLETPDHGFVYFGDGRKNLDLCFML